MPLQFPGLTGNPNTNVLDAFFRPQWFQQQQQDYFSSFPDVDTSGNPVGGAPPDYLTSGYGFGLSPETTQSFVGGLHPDLQGPAAAAAEQNAMMNAMRMGWFDNWRDMMGWAYNKTMQNYLNAMNTNTPTSYKPQPQQQGGGQQS